MKFVCPACERVVEISTYRVEGGVLLLRCSRCEAESAQMAEATPAPVTADSPVAAAPAERARPRPVSLVPASAPPAALGAADFAIPADRCPKCISPIAAGGASCKQCGLAFANALPEEYGPSADLAVKWSELLPRWGEEKAHDTVLFTAATAGELAAFGRLYRIRLAHAPEDALARRGLAEVLRLATVPAILPSAPAERAGVPSWQRWAIGAVGVVLLVLLVQIYRMTRGP